MSEKPKTRVLPSGWVYVAPERGYGFAQVPPGFDAERIPDKYIFQPEWNREAVNRAWRALRQQPTEGGAG